METKLVYCDETGDDGLNTCSSDDFILTSLYMPSTSWQKNFDIIRELRKILKQQHGFHIDQEMHTKYFLSDKNPYRTYGWSTTERQDILLQFAAAIKSLNASVVNVIIDKTSITTKTYSVLETALTYNIQRIENDSKGGTEWNYLLIADEGRIAPMRTITRAKRKYNPIPSQYNGYVDDPIKGMVEDVMEKSSKESYFIQCCDFISYFVHLYYLTQYKGQNLPNRVGNVIDIEFVKNVVDSLSKIFNQKASHEKYGLVIYPRQ